MLLAHSHPLVDSLYGELLAEGLRYFVPDAQWAILGPTDTHRTVVSLRCPAGHTVELEWLGQRYQLTRPRRPFTPSELRLMRTSSDILSTRYELLFNADLAAQSTQLFRGLPEDRYVAEFLEPVPESCSAPQHRPADRVANAIEVLRVSSMTTYENRRIATGVLLFGQHPDPCHPMPMLPQGSLLYDGQLTSIRSFYRLCDGLQTVGLVDREGRLVELVDVQEWVRQFGGAAPIVPCAARYRAHSMATLCGGHSCLVLTPNGEIKIFADGAQVFNFVDGRWRLTDAAVKYAAWQEAIGDAALAEVLFTVALNLAEDRRGGLFVVLNDVREIVHLVAASDLLTGAGPDRSATAGSKSNLHYLLRGRRILDLAPTVLESVARIDGAIVLDRDSRLLSFGAILSHPTQHEMELQSSEGGRTTAAVTASRYGCVLKVSEDGMISFHRDGTCVWEM